MLLCWEHGCSATTKDMVEADGIHQGNAECIKEKAQRVTGPYSLPWGRACRYECGW